MSSRLGYLLSFLYITSTRSGLAKLTNSRVPKRSFHIGPYFLVKSIYRGREREEVKIMLMMQKSNYGFACGCIAVVHSLPYSLNVRATIPTMKLKNSMSLEKIRQRNFAIHSSLLYISYVGTASAREEKIRLKWTWKTFKTNNWWSSGTYDTNTHFKDVS